MDHQRREPYSLVSLVSQIPWQLEEELEAFMEWSATPIQLDRDTKYKACQSATLGSNKEAILCYMGYLTKFKAVPPNQLSITFFRQPSLFAAFISYVLARSVGRGWIARHLSISKKVCSFLHSKQPWPQHNAMDDWLTRLDRQVVTVVPKLPAQELPCALEVFKWVEQLVDTCWERHHSDHEL